MQRILISIYQARNGGIYLASSMGSIPLTREQVETKFFNIARLKDFNYKDYATYYGIN